MTKSHKKRLLVGFDNILHSFRDGWNGDIPKNRPVEDAKWAMETLKKAGYELVIFSARDYMWIRRWLERHEIPFDDVTNKKIPALAVIDARAIRFEDNWKSIVRMFT
jgi:hypothetical protein